jgi:hypothetical protein
VSASPTEWTWPGDFPSRIAKAPVGTWVVLEVNPRGEILARYPPAVFEAISRGSLIQIGQFQTEPHAGLWAALDRISARNAAIGWKVFRQAAE